MRVVGKWGNGGISGINWQAVALCALEAGKDLSKLQAEDLMAHDRIAVTAETTIEEAPKIDFMEEQRLLNLSVKRKGGWPPP